jgi:hypothetical protein
VSLYARAQLNGTIFRRSFGWLLQSCSLNACDSQLVVTACCGQNGLKSGKLLVSFAVEQGM